MSIILDILVFVFALALVVGTVLVVWAGYLTIRREFFNPDGTLRQKDQ